MKNLATLLKELKEANNNMTKFIAKGNNELAIMWAEKVEKLELQIKSL